ETWLTETGLNEAPTERTKDTEEEPFYTHRYLPRKFKVAIALPPRNDCDVLANDIGLIAIEEQGKAKQSIIVGFNIAVGGGLGMSDATPGPWPPLATPVGLASAADVVAACEAIVAIQRDPGDRSDWAHARIKYPLDDYGLDWCKEQFRD